MVCWQRMQLLHERAKPEGYQCLGRNPDQFSLTLARGVCYHTRQLFLANDTGTIEPLFHVKAFGLAG